MLSTIKSYIYSKDITPQEYGITSSGEVVKADNKFGYVENGIVNVKITDLLDTVLLNKIVEQLKELRKEGAQNGEHPKD